MRRHAIVENPSEYGVPIEVKEPCRCDHRCDWPENPGWCGWCGGKLEEAMSAALVPTIPTLPDETELSREVTERPNWEAIMAEVTGFNGKELVDLGPAGEEIASQIAAWDSQIKSYLPAFLEWYRSSPYGAVEEAGEQFKQRIRLAEERRAKQARSECGLRLGEYKLEIDRRVEAERRRLEQEQREQAERERQAELEALRAQGTEEAKAEAELVAQAPVVPVGVSKVQAAVSAAVPNAPAKVSGRKVYERDIADWGAFLSWVALNPAWVGQLFSRQTDGTYRLSFARLKASAQSIPGVNVVERMEVSNRGK